MTIVLGVLVVICAVGWFRQRLALKTLAEYMKRKQYPAPTDAEVADCVRYALKNIWRFKTGF